MARVYLKLIEGKWKKVEKSDFWIDSILLSKLENLKTIQGEEWDGVMIVDGPERSGKSILGMICGWYLSEGTLTEDNFARGLKDAAKKIIDLPDKSVLIMDEGSTIFSSKEGTSKAQRKLVKILDVVGQKNLLFIICLPCFFDLIKTIAVRRSKFLLHVYPDEKYKRGQFVIWGERSKPKLYKFGKKNFDSYAYPRADHPPSEYFNFKPPFYEKYLREVKAETLKEVLEDALEDSKNFGIAYKQMIDIAGRIKEVVSHISDEKIGQILKVHQTTANEWVTIYKRAREMEEAAKYKVIATQVNVLGEKGATSYNPLKEKDTISEVESK